MHRRLECQSSMLRRTVVSVSETVPNIGELNLAITLHILASVGDNGTGWFRAILRR